MTASVVTRAQCGLRVPRSVSHNITPAGVTDHWNGDAIPGFPWDHSRCPSIWRADQAYHMDHNGWVDIAYTGGICIHGYIFEGRWWGARTAANGTDNGNQKSYAFCYMAGTGQPFTDAAKLAFLDAHDMARSVGGAGAAVWPHRFWFNTDCPGDDVAAWIAAGLPRPAGAVPAPAPTTAHLSVPVGGFAVTPSGAGYYMVAEDGGVFTFGDAIFHGSLPGIGVRPNAPIVGMAVTPSGGGYWLASADGGVYAFGDAGFHGSAGGIHLNASIGAIARTPSAAGYWLVARDGGIFSYGDAPFLGSAA